MNRRRRHLARLGVDALESRQLLSGLAASWIGQDGHDDVGRGPGLVPNGVQDVRIGVSGLPTDLDVRSIEVLGYGGGRWIYGDLTGSWGAAFSKGPAAGSGDVSIEPDRVEVGREFHLIVRFADGTGDEAYFQGGAADPELRVSDSRLAVDWIGQTGTDLVGPHVSVGPDGYQDVRLRLRGLSAVPIQSVNVDGPPGISWGSGPNGMARDRAELERIAPDADRAELSIAPDRDLDGQVLRVQVVYEDGSTDESTLIAGRTDPRLATAPTGPLPTIRSGPTATWIGQRGSGTSNAGLVEINLAGLPTGRAIRGATLSGDDHTSWVYRADGVNENDYPSDLYASKLLLTAGGGGSARLAFAPAGHLDGVGLTLRIGFRDGTIAVTRLKGGPVDLGLLSTSPEGGTIAVTAGVDLQALSRRYGRIELAPGTYRLDRPLVLADPIAIVAPHGNVTLQFRQPGGSEPWSSAIKVLAGNTTLDGFSIRFDGPVRWQEAVDYGPAIVGGPDRSDPQSSQTLTNVQINRLDIQAPVPSRPNEEAPRSIRFTDVSGGVIAANRVNAGPIEILGGPWSIRDNTFLGVRPGTWAFDLIAAHYVHDLEIVGNTAKPAADSGRVYRFLALTGTSDHTSIRNNSIVGLGIRDADVDPPNAPEVILTEAYRLHYEGRLASVSPDGLILRIPRLQGDPAGTGDVVALLDGPAAGKYVAIAQKIDDLTYLLADSLPVGANAISISSGHRGLTVADNRIDLGDDSKSSALVMVGSQFGTQVLGNVIEGGVEAIRASAFPTEQPGPWGWSHTPWLGGRIERNTIVDSKAGVVVSVMHGPLIVSNSGRTYLTTTILDNLIRWSDAFAVRGDLTSSAPGIRLGEVGSIDPAESVVSLAGNRADVPAGSGPRPTVRVISANVNGNNQLDASLGLTDVRPAAPGPLGLVRDSGVSDRDRLTNDGRVTVSRIDPTVHYEYALRPDGPFHRVDNPAAIRPAGLVEGDNTFYLRAVDARGRRGPATSLRFRLDRTPPIVVKPDLLARDDLGVSNRDDVTTARRLGFAVENPEGGLIQLLRDGNRVAEGRGQVFTDPGPLTPGTYRYIAIRFDAAGNRSVSGPLVVKVVAPEVPPAPADSPGPGRPAGPVEPGKLLVPIIPSEPDRDRAAPGPPSTQPAAELPNDSGAITIPPINGPAPRPMAFPSIISRVLIRQWIRFQRQATRLLAIALRDQRAAHRTPLTLPRPPALNRDLAGPTQSLPVTTHNFKATRREAVDFGQIPSLSRGLAVSHRRHREPLRHRPET